MKKIFIIIIFTFILSGCIPAMIIHKTLEPQFDLGDLKSTERLTLVPIRDYFSAYFQDSLDKVEVPILTPELNVQARISELALPQINNAKGHANINRSIGSIEII